MENKITLSQLARTLAQKMGMPQKKAEAFLKEFFDSIAENVKTDKLVKVKGLGTFKLIDVNDRESVNVHTGERIVIPGHSKLSFTPEASLRDAVNRPFADFQTVVINDETNLEDMERVPQEEPEAVVEPEAVEQQDEPEVAPEQESAAEQVATPAEESEELPSVEPEKSEPEPVVEVEEEVVAVPEEKKEEPVKQETVKEEQKKPRGGAKTFVMIVVALLLCVFSYFVGHYSLLEGLLPKQKQEPVKQQVVEAAPDTIKAEPVQVEPVEEVQYAQVPDGKYKIVGTRKTHVMKPGDYITRIALKEYGDKEMAQYIIVHNAFSNPDKVPIGQEIKLPELQEIE
ncbi:MAG: HU family DNA-binding protein [Bacteroidaceae bacterium]|nr:HU family DNA-binding protein [Bacteroidaceae bacterium]